MGARHRCAAITGSKFRIESYPLVASSQHVGAAAAVTILQLEFMLGENFNQSEFKKINFGTYATDFLFWNL